MISVTRTLALIALTAPRVNALLALPAPATSAPLTLVSGSARTTTLADELAADTAGGASLVVFGTYAGDFNMVEYAQKLRHYLPILEARGLSRAYAIVNGSPGAASMLSQLLDLPDRLVLLSDVEGAAGRAFGVGRGWLADRDDISPYVKLFGMLIGLGAAGTLPSVIAGYIGNPSGVNGWIESALLQGEEAGRWPNGVVEPDGGGGAASNSFSELPLVGGWGRRPLELATLRLQNMVGVSLANWRELGAQDDRCITQLGGCALLSADGEVLYEWRDTGICNTAHFEDLLRAL